MALLDMARAGCGRHLLKGLSVGIAEHPVGDQGLKIGVSCARIGAQQAVVFAVDLLDVQGSHFADESGFAGSLGERPITVKQGDGTPGSARQQMVRRRLERKKAGLGIVSGKAILLFSKTHVGDRLSHSDFEADGLVDP